MVFNHKPQFELHRTEQQRQLVPLVIPLYTYYYPKPLAFSRNLIKKKLTTKNFLYDNIGNSTNAMDVTALTQAKIKALTVMAEKLGCSLSQLAIAW